MLYYGRKYTFFKFQNLQFLNFWTLSKNFQSVSNTTNSVFAVRGMAEPPGPTTPVTAGKVCNTNFSSKYLVADLWVINCDVENETTKRCYQVADRVVLSLLLVFRAFWKLFPQQNASSKFSKDLTELNFLYFEFWKCIFSSVISQILAIAVHF